MPIDFSLDKFGKVLIKNFKDDRLDSLEGLFNNELEKNEIDDQSNDYVIAVASLNCRIRALFKACIAKLIVSGLYVFFQFLDDTNRKNGEFQIFIDDNNIADLPSGIHDKIVGRTGWDGRLSIYPDAETLINDSVGEFAIKPAELITANSPTIETLYYNTALRSSGGLDRFGEILIKTMKDSPLHWLDSIMNKQIPVSNKFEQELQTLDNRAQKLLKFLTTKYIIEGIHDFLIEIEDDEFSHNNIKIYINQKNILDYPTDNLHAEVVGEMGWDDRFSAFPSLDELHASFKNEKYNRIFDIIPLRYQK